MMPFAAPMLMTATSGGAAPAPTDGNLLFSVFVTDNPPKDSVSATALTAAGNAYGDTASERMVFDGTGDWFSFASTARFDPTDSWTIEFHANVGSSESGNIFSRGASGNGKYEIYLPGTGAAQFYCDKFSTGSPLLSASSAMTGAERHYAICKDGSTWRLYIDGVQVASATWADKPDSAATDMYIGSSPISLTTRDVNGTVGRLLISNTCRYPNGTTFTPPSRTSHLTPLPAFYVVPTISGNPWTGQTLTCNPGSDTGSSRAYQWYSNGAAISGATSATYTVQSGDVGTSLKCRVTATNANGTNFADTPALTAYTANPIRGSSLAYVNNASSVALSLPSGAAAGDLMVIVAGHGWGVNTPSGWTSRSNLTGGNYNGAVFTKVLSSGDISAGSISVSFGGAYYGVVAGVAFVGSTSGYRDIGASRNSSGAASRTVTTGTSPQVNDFLILFGSARVNAAVSSSSLGVTLQSNTQNEASSILRFGICNQAGAQSGTVSYAGSPSGDYQALVAVAP